MTDPREDRPQFDSGEARAARRAQARRVRDRRRRGLALALCAVVVVVVAIVALVGGGSAPRRNINSQSGVPGRTQAPATFRVAALGTLPAPVQFPAAAAIAGGRVVLLGGLDSSETSTAAVMTLSGGHSAQAGLLPVAQHDAQAATL